MELHCRAAVVSLGRILGVGFCVCEFPTVEYLSGRVQFLCVHESDCIIHSLIVCRNFVGGNFCATG